MKEDFGKLGYKSFSDKLKWLSKHSSVTFKQKSRDVLLIVTGREYRKINNIDTPRTF